MERLTDEFIAKDLAWIYEEARDFTRETELQIGAEKFTILASLQASEMEFSASEKPVNAYSLSLTFRTKDVPKPARKKLSQDAIIYVDGSAYRVIDSADCRGLMSLSLEKGTSRGNSMSGRQI